MLLDPFLRRMISHDLLSSDEEKRLILLAQQGDRNSKERLITSNQRLVFSQAKRFMPYADIEDLMSEGNIGLLKAVETVNPQESKFTTYAYRLIYQALCRYITGEGTFISLGEHETRMKKEYDRLVAEHLSPEETPTEERVQDHFNKTFGRNYDMATIHGKLTTYRTTRVRSLDSPFDDEGHSLLDVIHRSDGRDYKEPLPISVEGVRGCIDELSVPDHVKEVLHGMLLNGLTRKEMSERIGKSPDSVRGYYYKGLTFLRDALVQKNVRPR